MKKALAFAVSIVIIISFFGCAGLKGSGSDSSRPAASIKVFFDGKPNHAYKTIGTVSTRKNVAFFNKSQELILSELREKAADIGADALINITDTGYALTAVAVKYVNKR